MPARARDGGGRPAAAHTPGVGHVARPPCVRTPWTRRISALVAGTSEDVGNRPRVSNSIAMRYSNGSTTTRSRSRSPSSPPRGACAYPRRTPRGTPATGDLLGPVPRGGHPLADPVQTLPRAHPDAPVGVTGPGDAPRERTTRSRRDRYRATTPARPTENPRPRWAAARILVRPVSGSSRPRRAGPDRGWRRMTFGSPGAGLPITPPLRPAGGLAVSDRRARRAPARSARVRRATQARWRARGRRERRQRARAVRRRAPGDTKPR